MASDITLSSAVRSNLLSLQNTADLLGKTQEKLATGLKVNSALDDPTAFFTASALNSRASDLNRLQDFVGNAVQTLKAADEGISALTKLVESAEATARQALQTAAGSITAASEAGTVSIAADVKPTVTGTDIGANQDLITDLGFGDGDTIVLNLNGVDYTVVFEEAGATNATAGTDTATTNYVNLDDFNEGGGGTAEATLTDLASVINGFAELDSSVATNQLTIASSTIVDDLTITIVDSDGGGGAANQARLAALGLGGSGAAGVAVIEPTNATLGALSGTIDFTVGSNATKTITFGTDDSSSEVNTLAELNAELAGLTGGTLTTPSNNLTVTASSVDDSIVIGGTASVLTALGFDSAGETVYQTVGTESTGRTAFATQFDDLRTQIDQLVKDAGFNGVNLLDGDSLTVTFNEDGSSTLGVSGVTFNSAGLGVSAAINNFQHDTNISAAVTELSAATATLRSQASKFGSNLSVVETRQDFTKNLINVLETGAANLTLADTNEEGANLLALQTRQQLSSTALSLASQADQNVLRLF